MTRSKLVRLDIPEGGVRFQCQGSGKCCVSHGEFGNVYMSLDDRRRMAKVLKMTTQQFTRTHCKKSEGYWALKDNPEGPACIFLEGKKCGVYEGRPTQCRTWPFWPEVLSAKAWKQDVVSFCPGIGKGRLYSPLEIETIAIEQNRNERTMLNEK